MRGKLAWCLLAVGLFATVANAMVFYDPTDTTGSMTANGWSLASDSQTDIDVGKSRDVSHSDPGGSNGVWHIEDINSPANTYMKAYRNDPGSLDQSRGMVMARINMFGSPTNAGTFGYSSATSNRSLLMSIREGVVNFKGGSGSGTGSAGRDGSCGKCH